MEKRDQLIDQLEQRLAQRTETETLFIDPLGRCLTPRCARSEGSVGFDQPWANLAIGRSGMGWT